MSRKSTSTTPATGKPRAKRQSGYVITIKGFVPIGTTFADQRAALDALEAASKGDPELAITLMSDTTVSSKLTTRTIDAPATSESTS